MPCLLCGFEDPCPQVQGVACNRMKSCGVKLCGVGSGSGATAGSWSLKGLGCGLGGFTLWHPVKQRSRMFSFLPYTLSTVKTKKMHFHPQNGGIKGSIRKASPQSRMSSETHPSLSELNHQVEGVATSFFPKSLFSGFGIPNVTLTFTG